MLREIKNVKDLKEFINNIDESSPIFIGTWNGYSDTYTVADHAIIDKYEAVENDFFGTRGKMDKRLFNPEYLGKDIIFVGSLFHRNVDNKEIDFPSEPNEPIELINGKDGDHDLFWKSNKFVQENDYWKLTNDEEHWFILYYPSAKQLIVDHLEKYHFEGECIGVEDFFDIMKACKIQHTWRIG